MKTNLNWINIMCNHNQLCLLLFYQLGNRVGARTQFIRPFRWRCLLLGRLRFSFRLQPDLPLNRCLWLILTQQIEQCFRCLFVNGLRELVDRWRHLETFLQDGFLPLNSDVLGPFHETRQITWRLDVLTDAKVAGAFLEQGVDLFFLFDFLDG